MNNGDQLGLTLVNNSLANEYASKRSGTNNSNSDTCLANKTLIFKMQLLNKYALNKSQITQTSAFMEYYFYAL